MSRYAERHEFLRKYFGEQMGKTRIPPLLKFYDMSYETFFQMNRSPGERENVGLEAILRSVFPFEVKPNGKSESSRFLYLYSHYRLEPPEASLEECRSRGLSYAGTLHVVLLRIPLEKKHSELRHVFRHPSSLEKYLCVLSLKGIPFLTPQHTFFLNGIERALLSQLQRCPGLYLSKKRNAEATFKLIPYYGINLQLELAKSNQIYIRLLGKRRIPLPLFLFAMGFSYDELFSLFFPFFRLRQDPAKPTTVLDHRSCRPVFDLKTLLYGRTIVPLRDASRGHVLIPAGTWITPDLYQKILNSTFLNPSLSPSQWKCMSLDPWEESSFSSSAEGHFLTLESTFSQYPSEYYVPVQEPSYSGWVSYHSESMPLWKRHYADAVKQQQGKTKLVAFSQMVQMMNGKSHGHVYGELERDEFMKKFFLDPVHYNLSQSGRDQVNSVLHQPRVSFGILTKLDFLSMVVQFLSLPPQEEENVYQLQNRKIRLPGDLFGYFLFKAFLHLKRRRDFAEKFEWPMTKTASSSWRQNTISLFGLDSFLPSKKEPSWKLLESSESPSRRWMAFRSLRFQDPQERLGSQWIPFAKRQLDQFLSSSNLSQLLDQLNPVSEWTHLRRLSLLGPDGLNKDNVSLETRDVQSSFFGRICPIETPEGKSVGVVNSMTVLAQVDAAGDLLSPYQRLENGQLQSEVHYLSSKKENQHLFASWEEPRTHQLRHSWIPIRMEQEFGTRPSSQVEYIDASSKQMLSFTSSLIPFLEHNDGNRALMGSNMQRQAVPPLLKEIPLMGTGSEDLLGNVPSSQTTPSQLIWRDANLSFLYQEQKLQVHSLLQYEKANQKSVIHQTIRPSPMMHFSDRSRLQDEQGTHRGEISIGHNLFLGFFSMNGYSFEDSIVISDRLLKESFYTSLHTKEIVVTDWDTEERITRDIPGPSVPSYLDESGVIRVGTRLQGGEVLVGKVRIRSKLRKPLSEKEAFLHTLLFQSTKQSQSLPHVKVDTSERFPLGMEGCVLDVKKYFSSSSPLEGSIRTWKRKIHKVTQSYLLQMLLLQHHLFATSLSLESWNVDRSKSEWKTLRNAGNPYGRGSSRARWIWLQVRKQLTLAWYRHYLHHMACLKWLESKGSQESLRMIKILIGYTHRLKAGDKMTGRHGNKGVVCQVLPMAEMPYGEDGNALDVVLNPIGISSRMNLGQVFEVHLGWSGISFGRELKQMLRREHPDSQYRDLEHWLLHVYGPQTREGQWISKLSREQRKRLLSRLVHGIPMATMPFEGASSLDVEDFLEWGGRAVNGQGAMFDGRTGERFDREVTMGHMYVLKLNHLVDEKIHSRFTGPYNRVTEQPLGGKSLEGGQRFGEMEVWALQAYGAAYTLFDMVTVKSDSRARGEKRSRRKQKVYPEAFQVLWRELWSLGMRLRF